MASGVQAGPKDHQIFISGRIWHELYPKVDPGLFLEVIRDKINLRDYGTGINQFYFTFIVMEEITPNFSGWLGKGYYPKEARFEVAVELSYAEVVESEKEAVIHLMEQAFLQGIDQIAEVNLVAPFDHESFRSDVEEIFTEEDWYQLSDANQK